MGIIGHLVLLLGATLGFTLASGILIILVGIAFLIYWVIRNHIKLPNVLSHIYSTIRQFDLVELLMIVILLGFIVYPIIAHALIPPISYDEIAYHLAIPKIFINNGRISYIEFIPYSNWPMESEMLFGLALLFNSEITAHLISYFAAVLVSCAIIVEVTKLVNFKIGILAGTMFLGTGAVSSISGTALVEPILTLMTFLAMVTFMYWVRNADRRLLILSALFAGFAASTKFNAAVIAAIIGLFCMITSYITSIRKPKTAIHNFILYGLIAFIIVSPWYFKSWIQTGNPLWGFFMDVFPTRNWDSYGQAELMNFIQQPNLSLSLKNFIKAFYLITIKPGEIGPTNFRIGWAALPFLVFSIGFLFIDKIHWRKRSIIYYWALFVVFYLSWFFQTHQARFFMPYVPILIILSSLGIGFLERIFYSLRHLIYILTIAVILINSWVCNPNERGLINDGWRYTTGRIDRDTFLLERIQGYSAFIYANQNLPKDAYVLMGLYEGRGYLLNRDYSWANPMAQRIIQFEKYNDPSRLVDILKSMGFTHIIFRTGQPERFREVISNGDHITDLFYEFLETKTEFIYRSEGGGEAVEIYKIIYNN
jgi:4-amino-4-deoxy-L-arabinose transferase-like glycosyltransferase